MKSKNLMKMVALAAVLSTGFASCSSDDDADNTVVNGTQAALNQARNACGCQRPGRRAT